MGRTLEQQIRDFRDAIAELVKKYQFRDRNETVAYGLSVSQAYALRALHRRGPLAMGELAQDLHLSVSTVTRVVDPLVDKGLVRRSRSAHDRRVCRVELAPRGFRLWRRLEDELMEIDEEILSILTGREREAVIRVLRTLSRATDAWRARKAAQPLRSEPKANEARAPAKKAEQSNAGGLA
ncbi:MAG: MarR family transcriptional regulator [Myxococcota bacterium]